MQVISQVELPGQTKVQLLPVSHVSLHVRFVAQVKSQTCPARHVHSFPQLPFDGPTAASGLVVVPELEAVPEEEEEEETPLLDVFPELVVGTAVPASPSVPVFQS